MKALLSALCAIAALTAPANAQDAARAGQTLDTAHEDVALGLRLCLGGGSDMEAWAQTFYDAGFTGEVERSAVNSDTTHRLRAPSGAAEVELYYGEMPEYCAVTSGHMGVAAAAGVLDRVMPTLRPGYARKVTTGPDGTRCVRYEDPTSPIGHVVGVLPGGDSNECTENGTSRIYSSYRV
ncbi:hypothetical protein P1J78_16250 [Psychromarinibacter sp. C21-152]|uniref:Uncharacterized protein n=1 Tax=Psychromarinibacter sediminicola TaxID=3033385 RepID=A0AAE3NRQ4_9RHOB|nr:hypothetical protein [Psychromarinibacter sediminicola]MDF0602293.1 hypothetical protein [Psychromarinibacter sediminicola]